MVIKLLSQNQKNVSSTLFDCLPNRQMTIRQPQPHCSLHIHICCCVELPTNSIKVAIHQGNLLKYYTKVFLIFYWCFHFWLIKFLYSIYSQMGNSTVVFIFMRNFIIIIEYVSMAIKQKEIKSRKVRHSTSCVICGMINVLLLYTKLWNGKCTFQLWWSALFAHRTERQQIILIKLEYNKISWRVMNSGHCVTQAKNASKNEERWDEISDGRAM